MHSQQLFGRLELLHQMESGTEMQSLCQVATITQLTLYRYLSTVRQSTCVHTHKISTASKLTGAQTCS